MRRIIGFGVGTLLFLGGCASSLSVTDSNKTGKLPGIPVGAPMLVEIETTKSYRTVGTPPKGCDLEHYCKERITSAAKFLPLGKTYYVNFDSAPLAKSEFTLKFAESGVLTEVALNSTPSTDALTGLLDTILPFVTAPKAALGPPGVAPGPIDSECPLPPEEVFKKHCIESGSKVTKVREIEVEYVDKR